MTTDDGGFAFPSPENRCETVHYDAEGSRTGTSEHRLFVEAIDDREYGMTLRDWFAGQALAGVVVGVLTEADGNTVPASVAESAYRLADAMLIARTKD